MPLFYGCLKPLNPALASSGDRNLNYKYINYKPLQKYKPKIRKLAGKLQQTLIQRPWEMLGMDLMSPFPKSSKQNVYLLDFVDCYSRWLELFPLRKATAETISQVLIKDILTRSGLPHFIFQTMGHVVLNLECGTKIYVCLASSDQPHRESELHLENHGCILCREPE